MSDLKDAFVEFAKDRGINPPDDATADDIMSAILMVDGVMLLTLGSDDDERWEER